MLPSSHTLGFNPQQIPLVIASQNMNNCNEKEAPCEFKTMPHLQVPLSS